MGNWQLSRVQGDQIKAVQTQAVGIGILPEKK